MTDILIINLPSAAGFNITREWAGGYGTALISSRDYPGHDQSSFDMPRLGFLYIGRFLMDCGFSVKYLDLQQKQRFVMEDLLSEIEEENPRLILSDLSLPSFDLDLEILKKIKESTSLKIALSGQTAKDFKEKILKEGYADYLFISNEELSVGESIQMIMNGIQELKGVYHLVDNNITGSPLSTKMKDLNFIDFPAYELLNFDTYKTDYLKNKDLNYMGILSSKGCPYRCDYCPYPIAYGERLIYRSPELVVDDIQKLVEQHGVEFIVFTDELFVKHHCEKICNLILEREIKVKWLCQGRYDQIDEKRLDLMYRAGCRQINYGLESGDETLFRLHGKSNARKGLDHFGHIIAKTKENKIFCHTHLMIGLPNESEESINNTIDFLKRYRPDAMQVSVYTPYPGTPLAKELQKGQLVNSDSYFDYTGYNAIVPTKYMSIEELNRAKDRINSAWEEIQSDPT